MNLISIIILLENEFRTASFLLLWLYWSRAWGNHFPAHPIYLCKFLTYSWPYQQPWKRGWVGGVAGMKKDSRLISWPGSYPAAAAMAAAVMTTTSCFCCRTMPLCGACKFAAFVAVSVAAAAPATAGAAAAACTSAISPHAKLTTGARHIHLCTGLRKNQQELGPGIYWLVMPHSELPAHPHPAVVTTTATTYVSTCDAAGAHALVQNIQRDT